MLGGRESSCQCISRSSWGLRSHWRIQNFNLGGPHGERGAYNGGLGAEPPAESRGRAPGQGVRGAESMALGRPTDTANLHP